MINKRKIGISIIPTKNINLDFELVLKFLKNGINKFTFSDFHRGYDFIPLFEKVSQIKEKDLMLGTAVTNFITHKPLEIAEFYLNIYKIFDNIFLGLGTGDWELLEKNRISIKDAIKKLLLGMNIIKEKFNSTNARIPIFIGAQGARMIKIAKENSDGIIFNISFPDHINKAINILGNTKQNFKKFVISQAYILDEEEKAIKNARKSAAIIYSGISDSAIKMYDLDLEKRNRIRNLIIEGKIDEARNMLDADEVKKLVICGDIENSKRRIEEILSLNIDLLILGLPMGVERNETSKNILRILEQIT